MEPAEAKQFLIRRSVEQAQVEDVQLSDVEKQMLYFTEAHPTLPGMHSVNEEFERNYDDAEYEAKIARLLKHARAHNSSSREAEWQDALDALKHEDHYILVMVHQAFGYGSATRSKSRLRDFLMYIVLGIGLVLLACLVSFWRADH
jgi:hypothetical protein